MEDEWHFDALYVIRKQGTIHGNDGKCIDNENGQILI